MDDLAGLFTSTAPGTAVLHRLNERISEQKRYKKRENDAIWQVYTPNEAICLVLGLEMPRKRECLLLYLFFALLMRCATALRGVQVATCKLSKPYHSHTSSNVVIHFIRHTYIP